MVSAWPTSSNLPMYRRSLVLSSILLHTIGIQTLVITFLSMKIGSSATWVWFVSSSSHSLVHVDASSLPRPITMIFPGTPFHAQLKGYPPTRICTTNIPRFSTLQVHRVLQHTSHPHNTFITFSTQHTHNSSTLITQNIHNSFLFLPIISHTQTTQTDIQSLTLLYRLRM